MKTKVIVFALVLFALTGFTALRAQFVGNIELYPESPISGEPVSVIVTTMFTSGDCPLVDYYVFIDNLPEVPVVNVSATYCVGALTVICERTDTIPLGVLPSGDYVLQFQILSGLLSGPGTCLPPFILGASVSFPFVVDVGSTSYGITGLALLNSDMGSYWTWDTVWVTANLIFPSAPCELDALTLSTDPATGNYILNANYCLGPLDMICMQTDTFALYPPHNIGEYTISLNVASCDGFVNDTDSINFEIIQSEYANTPHTAAGLTLPANLAEGGLQFDFSKLVNPQPATLILYSTDGKTITKIAVQPGTITRYVPLQPGFYLYSLQQQGKLLDRGKAFVY